MKLRIFLLVFTLMALPLMINSRPGIRVIEPGQFHSYEIAAKTGQRWLGLFVNGRRSRLRYSTINVRGVYDDVTDYGAKRKTGKRITVNSDQQPVFLLNNSSTLKPGPVKTVFEMKADEPSQGLEKFPQTLKLGRRSYILKVVSPDKTPVQCLMSDFPKNARLVLASGHAQQVLYTLDVCGNDPIWYLVWAGDIDRDGKLDLYVNVTQHYDYSDRVLLLSSLARKGKLVRDAAIFETGGC
jgi:hypothetical protein